MTGTYTFKTPAPLLVNFIMQDFSVNGAHLLAMPYGENSFFGFGKYRGELDFNFLEMKHFIEEIDTKIEERNDTTGCLSFLSLTTFADAQPPADGKTMRFSDLRGPQRRYGWLLNRTLIQPLSARSLKEMVGKQSRVKLVSSAAP